MKKILFLFAAILLFSIGYSQTTRTFPAGWGIQPLGGTNVVSNFKGVVYPSYGYAPAIWADTAAMNSSPMNIKNIPLFQASTVDGKNWYRSYDLSKWNEIGSGSGAGTVTSVGLSMPGFPVTVTNSPVTGAGTLTATPAGTQGDIPYFSSSTAISLLAKNTTASRYLSNTGSSNNPAWAQVDLSNGVTSTLPATNGGTGFASYTVGDLLYANTTTSLAKLTVGSSSQILIGGTIPSWSSTLPSGLALKKVYAPLVVSNDSISQRFNVLAYGAVGDGSTDDTPGFQAAINAWAASGGKGKVIVPSPSSFYKIAGPMITSGAGGAIDPAQIIIPRFGNMTGDLPRLEIVGEVAPNQVAIAIDDLAWPMPTRGVIIKSTSTSSVGAIFGSDYYSTAYGNLNFVDLTFKNLIVRVRSDSAGVQIAPRLTAFDMSHCSMYTFEDVRIDTESPATTSATPNSNAIGIKCPAVNNFGLIRLRNVVVQNYYVGVQMTEHTMTENCDIVSCYIGMQYVAGFHPSLSLGDQIIWCRTNIQVNGVCNFSMKGLTIENYVSGTSKWYDHVLNLDEATIGSIADIEYIVVRNGGTVAINQFARNVPAINSKIRVTSLGNQISFDPNVNLAYVGNPLLTSTATTNPSHLSFQQDYSSVAGDSLKIRLFGTAGTTHGFGVSDGQMDYKVPTGVIHSFYVNTTRKVNINSLGLGVGVIPTDAFNVVSGTTNLTLNSSLFTVNADNGAPSYASGYFHNGNATANRLFVNHASNTGLSLGIATAAKFTMASYQVAAGNLDFALVNEQTASNTIEVDGTTNNVGIGVTPSTSFKLDVGGAIQSSANTGVILKFGSTTGVGTTTPGVISSGASYGTNTAGTAGNLKWRLYDDGTAANYYGIGMSAGLMEIRSGSGGGVSLYTNNGVSALALASSTAATFASTVDVATGYRIGNAAASRKMLVGNGTNFVASTETWAVPGASGNVLTSDGTNWTSATPVTTAAGTYTPTLTNGANVAASTAYDAQYMRVGNTVTVSGRIDIDPTLTATSTVLGISLPIASALAAANELGGAAACPTIAAMGAAMLADVANARATLQFVSSDVSNNAMYFTFTYKITPP